MDTNVIVSWERTGADQRIDELQKYASLFVSAVTVGELYAGVYRSPSMERVRSKGKYYDVLLKMMTVLPFETHAARVYGRMVAQMMRSGNLTGKHDLMIAATAICYGIPVLTADADFSRIPAVDVIPYEIS